jgi:uncharacterized protein DUF3310
MITTDTLINPPYYQDNRNLQPIEVIENWSLCHHLACVVKYLARAGRKGNALEDLKKAEWYLEREIDRFHGSFNKCHLSLIDAPFISLESVLGDWDLSAHLEKTLTHLKTAKTKGIDLEELLKALVHLKKEIMRYEK